MSNTFLVHAELISCGLPGTWQSKPEEVVKAVEYALKEGGYKHIDCAMYVLIYPIIYITSQLCL